MKQLFLIAAIVYSVAASSQITKVDLQASGLTCSMCSNAINKALKSLDFVDKINANIKTSTFEIFIKPGNNPDFDKLKKKVEDAGFFVSDFTATMHFNSIKIKSDEAIIVGDKTLKFLNVKEQVLNGTKTIRIIDKGFVSAKEYKKNTVASSGSRSEKIYHVTIKYS